MLELESNFVEYGPVPSRFESQALRLPELSQLARNTAPSTETNNDLDNPLGLAILIKQAIPIVRQDSVGGWWHTGWAIEGFAGRENNEGQLKTPPPEIITHEQAGNRIPNPGDILVMVKQGMYSGPNIAAEIIKFDNHGLEQTGISTEQTLSIN